MTSVTERVHCLGVCVCSSAQTQIFRSKTTWMLFVLQPEERLISSTPRLTVGMRASINPALISIRSFVAHRSRLQKRPVTSFQNRFARNTIRPRHAIRILSSICAAFFFSLSLFPSLQNHTVANGCIEVDWLDDQRLKQSRMQAP